VVRPVWRGVSRTKKMLDLSACSYLPVEGKKYIIYNDASKNELGCVLIQDDKVIASRQLQPYERTTQLMIWT